MDSTFWSAVLLLCLFVVLPVCLIVTVRTFLSQMAMLNANMAVAQGNVDEAERQASRARRLLWPFAGREGT